MKSRFLYPREETGPDTALQLKLYNGLMITDKVFDYSLNSIGCALWDGAATLVPVYPGFHFDGSDDYIYTDSTFQSIFRDSFSMSIWVKPDDGTPAAVDTLAGVKNGTDEDRVQLTIQTSGKIRFFVESNTHEAYAEENVASFTNGQMEWTHILVTAKTDATKKLRIYVNGIERTLGGAPADGDASGLTFADYTSNCNVNIGAQNADNTPDGFSLHFAGLVSDFRIYNRLLYDTEARSIYSVTRSRYGR